MDTACANFNRQPLPRCSTCNSKVNTADSYTQDKVFSISLIIYIFSNF